MRYYKDEEAMSLADIRAKIQHLYEVSPNIHVNVRERHPRTTRKIITNIPVVIKGVFPNVFQIEDSSSGKPRLYLHQYNEIVTKEIEIIEFSEPAAAEG